MTATPTPGDLSARTRLLNCAVDAINDYAALVGDDHDVGTCNCDLVDIANGLAALSALPAAGEPVGEVIEGFTDAMGGAAHVARWYGREPKLGTKLYTTPQPSAAEGTVEPFGYYIETLPPKARQSTFTRAPEIAEMEAAAAAGRVKVTKLYANAPADAAVGAQGDGCDHCGRHVFVVHGSDAHCNYCGRVTNRYKSAAPAAGKGVDFWTLEHACAACYGGEMWAAMAPDDKRAARERIQAALTRQPVAGDGDDAANWRRAKACMSAIGQSDKSVSYACALLLSENARKVNAGRAEITLRGITDGDEECGDWRITVEQLAAPAATPTDGGEGKS